MKVKRWVLLACGIGLAAIATLVAVVASSGSDTDGSAAAQRGGVLRIGTTGEIDSLNPFVGQNSNAYIAFMMQYPILVQYTAEHEYEGAWAKSWDVSEDNKVWTFHLRKGSWSDGKPLTADDAVWTGETILKYKDSEAASLSQYLSYVKSLSAPDPSTLVIKYERPVANVLDQLFWFYTLPKHVWEKEAGSDGKGLKAFLPEEHLPVVSGGPFMATKYDPKGTTIFKRNPHFYGKAPYADAVGYQHFENDDALIEAAKRGQLDLAPSLEGAPAAALAKSDSVEVSSVPGIAYSVLQINSNPKKTSNPELADPAVREAITLAVDREEIADVVYRGFAEPIGTFLPAGVGDLVNTDITVPARDVERANALLDDAGYERGADGVRQTKDGRPMEYPVLVPTGWVEVREFDIVKKGVAEIGITLKPDTLDGGTWFEKLTAPDGKYTEFDFTMDGWTSSVDPDFTLNTYTCGQYGAWNDNGYCTPEYDRLYKQQQAAVDPAERQRLIWQMQEQIIEKARVSIPLIGSRFVQATSKKWTGFEPRLFNQLSTRMWTDVHRTG